ncbi:Putative cell wall binding repeat 2 [Agrococcus baldri]|uniref:Cell wall binding repeat 2 n=1 Tax=Agrococcus baldri TaxID=153730 RepID=A0AA94HPY0_9MICO|nr:cell wall-binding repeat-containing protein [Agrococcus baldri]SFS18646.1 Putative cell wall binding repeat 2 [Agrococcus baldri]
MLVRALISSLAAVVMAASLIVAAPQPGQTAGPIGAAVEECLVRSAIVPLEVAADADARALREAAARTLQHALLLRHADAVAGAEIERDSGGEAVALRLVGVTGSPGADGLARAEVERLETHLRAEARSLQLVVGEVAEQPLTALCMSLDRVLHLDGETGDAIVSAAIDQRAASLRIGLDVAASAHPALERRIEALPSAMQDEPAATGADLLTELGLTDLGVPVELIADVADEPVSRMHDTDGYGGGNAIRVGNLACTTGFAVRTSDGASAVMSAGHCAFPLGANGGAVVSGHASNLCGRGSGSGIGRVSQNLVAGSRHVDSLVIRTGSARPTMWLGSGCSGSHEVPVHGAGQVSSGASVGFSGARQGERYATRTSEPAGCYDFGYWACSIYRSISSAPVPPWSNYACLPGDSGGPTFRHRSGGGVIALGLISASGYDLGINRCSWVDMATALHLSGATMMTHSSLTMAAPSRIAGQNRFETAALLSASGYPRGARQVYVASGELFPDALSAGAAAAHVRAPLLLTAAAALPAATRAELVRLAPTSIVLVGGLPSVSAAVEASLAELAPVTRLAGANRYETSALIAQHAFTDGAGTAFIATGRGFPDALAAGPVAAMQGAPILLVDGNGTASPATLAALDALGATTLTVVGGIPSVATAVVDAMREGRTATRVAGANRYQTAVRINAAFPARPPTLYIAAGNRFPDALAASAVAGARGAPLYLTPSSCLDGSLPMEHRRLGAPPIVLLGGTPTLTHDVTRYELCG